MNWENLIIELLIGSFGLVTMVFLVISSWVKRKDKEQEFSIQYKKELGAILSNVKEIQGFVCKIYWESDGDSEEIRNRVRKKIIDENMNHTNSVYYVELADWQIVQIEKLIKQSKIKKKRI